ncbi:extracellular solute-binding protein [Patescibacteria group bacterium]|nr:extracellular solute-binding protein [Patescibacteria group bacterium]
MAAQDIYSENESPFTPLTGPEKITPAVNPLPTTTTPPSPKKSLPKFFKPLAVGIGVLFFLFLIARLALSLFGSKKEKTVVWWGLWEDDNIVTPLINEYENSHPGIKIEYIKQSKEDYREKLTNALARGEGPDIFRFHNTWVSMFDQNLDALPSTVMSAGEFTKTFYPVASRDLAFGSSYAGIPLEYDGLTLFVNEDIFTKEGKNIPTTWDDLREVAKSLTQKDDRGVIVRAGVALGSTENVDHWEEIIGLMLYQNGADLNNPTGNLAETALQYFTLFSRVDGVWDETMPPSTVAFASGKVAMYFAPSWRAFEISQENPTLSFKTVPLPQLVSEDSDTTSLGYASYWVEGVWTKSKNKDVAWDFLKFMSSKDALEKLYKEASAARGFGEPYSRVDMQELLLDHRILGSIVALAPDAQTWFLASRTFDGKTGINTQVSDYFRDAINAINSGTDPKKAMEPLGEGISQVLSQYSIR